MVPSDPHESGVFNELDEVTLTTVKHLRRGGILPVGACGTVVAVWRSSLGGPRSGHTYEVEFSEPFPCLVTIKAESLALNGGTRDGRSQTQT